jgi:sugar/nucleoside kinase (ribokinase family)
LNRGTRRSITNRAHRYNFHPEQYLDALSDAKAVVLGSLFRAPFDEPDIVRQIVDAAHARGIPVFADTKLPNFTKLKLEDIADSLPMIDCITPNEEEARYYSGENEPGKMADVFLAAGVRSVIIKLGGRGCLFRSREETICLPAYDIDAVDAAGAGDNFLAGFVSEIVRGSGIREALAFANACGAVCTTAVGACTALRDREQVLALIREGVCPRSGE